MGLFAAILGGIGGLCAIFGIVLVFDVFGNTDFALVTVGWEFWLPLAGVFLLGSIATSLASRGGGYD